MLVVRVLSAAWALAAVLPFLFPDLSSRPSGFTVMSIVVLSLATGPPSTCFHTQADVTCFNYHPWLNKWLALVSFDFHNAKLHKMCSVIILPGYPLTLGWLCVSQPCKMVIIRLQPTLWASHNSYAVYRIGLLMWEHSRVLGFFMCMQVFWTSAVQCNSLLSWSAMKLCQADDVTAV